MSRFFSQKYKALTPYTPGEQPKDMQYVKLNTNESPFPPSPKAQEYAAKAAADLHLYPDPECTALTQKVADLCGVKSGQVLLTNGSDEILNFAFMAFCDEENPAVFCDITYGFYEVFAQLNGVPYQKIALKEDFSVDLEAFFEAKGTVFLANPNAPTGLCLPLSDIEKLLQSNPDRVVVVDEAYVDFGAESACKLVDKYDNLLVTQTFSKSRSMAGARLGFGVGCAALIQDLNTVKYSTNPYNINRMTMAAGLGVLEDEEYTKANCRAVMTTRDNTAKALKDMGFEVLDSCANFLFAKHPLLDGRQLYLDLKARGVLVRHFDSPRLRDYNRITVGSDEQMQILLDTITQIMEINQ